MNLDDLEAKARAATPGPWERDPETPNAGRAFVDVYADAAKQWGGRIASCNATEDAAFIAAANPDTVLKLVTLAKAIHDWSQIRHRSAADDDKLYQALSALGAKP